MRAVARALPAPAGQPLLLVPLALGASSIATLLVYFLGWVEMGASVRIVLLPAAAVFAALVAWTLATGRRELAARMLAGLWAGAFATAAYDLVRVPLAMSGIPVFKAISYFGTVILGQQRPDLASELAGWSYHLSNGIGFGLMYAVLVVRPRWWTAALWGLFLEAAMLATPYAEIFGYRYTQGFLAITLGSHVVYGLALWSGLLLWRRGGDFRLPERRRLGALAASFALAPAAVGAVGLDFHQRHAAAIPPSPPAYLGPHLYTTWNALEADRLATLWLLRRFVDPEARFHFVEPFTHIARGTPVDTPEAAVRRTGRLAAAEVLLAELGRRDDPRLALVGRMAHNEEITPWMKPAHPQAFALGREVNEAAAGCEGGEPLPCVERALAVLDRWYDGAGPEGEGAP